MQGGIPLRAEGAVALLCLYTTSKTPPRRLDATRLHRSPRMMTVLPSWLDSRWRHRGPPLSCGDDVMKRQWVRAGRASFNNGPV